MTPSLASILVAMPTTGSCRGVPPWSGLNLGVSGIDGASSSGGTGVEGATSVGALLGSLCDDDEGTKSASQCRPEKYSRIAGKMPRKDKWLHFLTHVQGGRGMARKRRAAVGSPSGPEGTWRGGG